MAPSRFVGITSGLPSLGRKQGLASAKVWTSLSMLTSSGCATTSMSPVIEFLLSSFGVHS
jgi:hypothetical protein